MWELVPKSQENFKRRYWDSVNYALNIEVQAIHKQCASSNPTNPPSKQLIKNPGGLALTKSDIILLLDNHTMYILFRYTRDTLTKILSNPNYEKYIILSKISTKSWRFPLYAPLIIQWVFFFFFFFKSKEFLSWSWKSNILFSHSFINVLSGRFPWHSFLARFLTEHMKLSQANCHTLLISYACQIC